VPRWHVGTCWWTGDNGGEAPHTVLNLITGRHCLFSSQRLGSRHAAKRKLRIGDRELRMLENPAPMHHILKVMAILEFRPMQDDSYGTPKNILDLI
jgi:hypothetical protein